MNKQTNIPHRFGRAASTTRQAPALDDLDMPEAWKQAFLDESLNDGGLVLISGRMGDGKTTTMSAIVRSRIETYGGMGTTVESPPELALHGKHGHGMCNQLHVGEYGDAGDFAGLLRDVRRIVPPDINGMLMVGETRNDATAAEVLLAASEGYLVLTTLQASSAKDAIVQFQALASSQMGNDRAVAMLEEHLRLCVHQTLMSIRDDPALAGWKRGRIALSSERTNHEGCEV